MKGLYFLILGFVLYNMGAQTQSTYQGHIVFRQHHVVRKGGELNLGVSLDLETVKLGSQQVVVLIPTLQSAGGGRRKQFAPVVIAGPKQYRALKRVLAFGSADLGTLPMLIEKRKNGIPQMVNTHLRLPCDRWMRQSGLIFHEKVAGCADYAVGRGGHIVMTSVFDEVFTPRYELGYVTPPVEPLKQRNEMYMTRLNFEIDKHVLLRNYKNNISILGKVDRIVHKIHNSPNLAVTKLKVTGYASSEGNYNRNIRLSGNRVLALAGYSQNRGGTDRSLLTANWKGEGWTGLHDEAAASRLNDKEVMLALIDGGTDIIRRKNRLQASNGGVTYRMLLQGYYPPLRRNEYTIAYVARAFNVDETRGLIRTEPRYLSLNKMFLVADTYSKDSKEFKKVFDIAARIYPDDPIAQLSMTALELEKGTVDATIIRLQRLDMPEARNNLGMTYLMKQECEKGGEYLEKAIDADI